MPDPASPDGMALEISFIATSESTFFNASEGVELGFIRFADGAVNTDRFQATYNGVDYYFYKK